MSNSDFKIKGGSEGGSAYLTKEESYDNETLIKDITRAKFQIISLKGCQVINDTRFWV